MSVATIGTSAAASYRFKPYAHHPDISPARLERYFSHALESTEARGGTRRWTYPWGLVELERLDFDSRALERPTGRLNWLIAAGEYGEQLDAKQRLLDAALEEARQGAISHLSARVASEDLSSLHALEARGFRTLDTILTFSRRPEARPAPPRGVATRLAMPEDAAALRRIAESSFRHDRYHADPAISAGLADRLHGSWVANSLDGFADAVLVADVPSGLAGFTTVKIDRASRRLLGVSIATIVLAATAAEARGRGVGRELTRALLEWAADEGVERVEVGTQSRNLAACQLYSAAGFRLVGSSVSLRWLRA